MTDGSPRREDLGERSSGTLLDRIGQLVRRLLAAFPWPLRGRSRPPDAEHPDSMYPLW